MEEYTENLVGFVKMFSLYNVMEPETKIRYVLQPETAFEVGMVALSFLVHEPGMNALINAIRHEKKECAEKIT